MQSARPRAPGRASGPRLPRERLDVDRSVFDPETLEEHTRIRPVRRILSPRLAYLRVAEYLVPDQSFSIRETQFVDPGTETWRPVVRFDIDFVALTSNNVTYAVAGDLLDHWGFFPGELPWGRVPAMGYGTVIQWATATSRKCRHFGFFPMADQHIVLANGTDAGLFGIGVHQGPHATAYRQFADVAKDPSWDPDREARVALLGLFLTSWLAEDLLFDNDNGADVTIITSASSRAGDGLVSSTARWGECRPHLRGQSRFVERLGCYTEIVTYDKVGEIDNNRRSVVVDMAGNGGPCRRAQSLRWHAGPFDGNRRRVIKSFGQHEMADPAFPVLLRSARSRSTRDWGASEPMRQSVRRSPTM